MTNNWQASIREAQALERAKIAAEEEKKAEKKKVRDAADAAKLRRALAFFGIDSAPTCNSWVIDAYEFWLRSSGDAVVFEDHGEKGISFNLCVCRPDTHALYSNPEDRPLLSREIQVNTIYHIFEIFEVNSYCQEVRAKLANALDALDEDHAAQVEYAQRIQAIPKTTNEPMSIEAQLARLIGELVSQEVRIQLGREEVE